MFCLKCMFWEGFPKLLFFKRYLKVDLEHVQDLVSDCPIISWIAFRPILMSSVCYIGLLLDNGDHVESLST